MLRIIISVLTIISCTSAVAEEPAKPKKKCDRSAGYSSRDATVLSMMGWGIGIFAGIATLFALLDSNPDHT